MQELDDEKRVEEALVQFLMGQFVNNFDVEQRNLILNPNQENVRNLFFKFYLKSINFYYYYYFKDLLHHTPAQTSINLISTCLETAKRKITSKKMKSEMCSNNPECADLEQLLQNFSKYIKKIPVLQRSEMDNWIEKQKKNKDSDSSAVSSISDIHKIINAVVHPDVINLIKSKLL